MQMIVKFQTGSEVNFPITETFDHNITAAYKYSSSYLKNSLCNFDIDHKKIKKQNWKDSKKRQCFYMHCPSHEFYQRK